MKEVDTLNIGKKVKECREKQGISRVQLADKVGITPAMLSFIESGKRTGSVKTLTKISKVLNVDISYLID